MVRHVSVLAKLTLPSARERTCSASEESFSKANRR